MGVVRFARVLTLAAVLVGTRAAFSQCGLNFAPSVNYIIGTVNRVAVGDFNGDGRADVLASLQTSQISLWLSDPLGNLEGPTNYRVAGQYYVRALGVADLNGDGFDDVVVATSASTSVYVFSGRPDGTLTNSGTYLVDGDPVGITFADFNQDGRPDIVTSNDNGTLSVLYSAPGGGFLTRITYTASGSPGEVVTGDFNGDGRQDVAFVLPNQGRLSIMLASADGYFGPMTDYPVGALPTSLAAGDFDGDGHTDLAISNYISGNVMLMVGVGNGTFLPGPVIPTAGGALRVFCGDFDRDGFLDLAVSSSVIGGAGIYRGTGSGTFLPVYPASAGWAPTDLASGDVDGDGSPDLVLTSLGGISGQGGVSVLLNRPPAAPRIYAQPVSTRACVTAEASFTITAAGPDLSYQWQWRPDPAADQWTDVLDGPNPATGPIEFIATDAQTATLMRQGVAGSPARQFVCRCVVANSCGTARSDAAVLAINSADFDGDGDSGTSADIEAFFACLSGSCCASCGSADFDADGDLGTDADIESFFRVLSGGPC